MLHEKNPPDDLFLWAFTREKDFQSLRAHMHSHFDTYTVIEPPLFNRLMMTAANRVSRETRYVSDERRIIRYTLSLPGGDVCFEDFQLRGFATDWHMVVPGDDPAILERIISAPFEVDEHALKESVRVIDELDRKLGDDGYFQIFMPSPSVAVSNCMHLENFLELCYTEPELVKGFCEEITRRISLCIDALFREKKFDATVTFGGSEQFTPPMMNPKSFDEFVVPYEGALVKQLKQYKIPIQSHCHGKISYAMPRIIEMGYDACNPVEPPPQGDLTYAQARAIAGDKLTIEGNIELSDLENCGAEEIRRQVFDILSMGDSRLILNDSGVGAMRHAPTENMARNYRAWADAYREFYRL
jgi:uroporphyrinogen-III decarboxylase